MGIRGFSFAALAWIGLLLFCGATQAQPPGGYVDLGTITNTTTDYNFPDNTFATATFSPNQVQWFKFTITQDAIHAAGFYLDINTTPRGTTNFDTEIGVYRPDGTQLAVDDDNGPGNYSQLSFGLQAPPRGPIPPFNGAQGGSTASGQNLALPAGEYYLAAGYFRMTFGATDFNVTSNGTTTEAFNLEFRNNFSAVPEPSTLAFIGAGVTAGGLGIHRWSKKRRKVKKRGYATSSSKVRSL